MEDLINGIGDSLLSLFILATWVATLQRRLSARDDRYCSCMERLAERARKDNE